MDLFSSKAELINDTTNSTTDLNNNINYIVSSSNNNDNNNNNNIKNNNNKRSVEEENDKLLPPAHFEEYNLLECICYRPTKVLECRQCHEYFNGRISLLCLEHPTDTFLMDFRHCPYCMAAKTNIIESTLTWQQIRQMEDIPLPMDSDDF